MKRILNNISDLGKLILMIGVLALIPLIIIALYNEEAEYALSFIIPAIGSILLGVMICVINCVTGKKFIKSSKSTVLIAWLYAILTGALPFFISNKLNFVQSIFESVSGWTTTGLSVMDVSVTPNIFLFHRSFMQYCGGVGFVLMMVVFVRNKNSASLYSSEGHIEQIEASLGKTAKAIFFTYIILFIIGTALYILAGMPVFDSIVHSMSSLSTGGFSTKVNSIGEFNSISIEAITIVLMIIGTTNFALILLLAKGKIKKAIKADELKFMIILLAIFIPIVALTLIFGVYMSVGEGIRHSIFNVVSALSTTGYSTVSYVNWTGLGIGVLIILMLIGGGSGSTAGGIKISRVYIGQKLLFNNLKTRIFNRNKVQIFYFNKPQGKEIITEKVIKDVLGYIGIYLVTFLSGSLLLSLTANCNIADACFEFASALGTVGLSVGITTTTTGNLTLIVEMIGMLLGRLEIYIVFIGIIDLFRRKKSFV